MKLLIKFYAKQKNGELIIADKKTFSEQLKSFKDKEIAVTIKPYYKNRSNQENRYYWSVIVGPISEAMGLLEPEQAHEFLKDMFLKEKVYIKIKNKVKEITIPIATKELSTMAFEDYLARCRMWASENLGLYIALPNEVEAY